MNNYIDAIFEEHAWKFCIAEIVVFCVAMNLVRPGGLLFWLCFLLTVKNIIHLGIIFYKPNHQHDEENTNEEDSNN